MSGERMNDRDKQKLARIGELERAGSRYGNQLGLLADVIRRRAVSKARIRAEGFPENLVKERLSLGEPLAAVEKEGLTRDGVLDYARELVEIFRRRGLVDGESPVERYLRGVENGGHNPIWTADWFASLGLTGQAIITEAMRPVFEGYRESYEPLLDNTEWLRPYCWVCGGEPDLAFLKGNDNRRYLYCGLCDASWPYLRLKCPFCGNEVQDNSVSFSIEGDTVHSVEACKVCSRYVKVIDTRGSGMDTCLFEIEAVLMTSLDEAARKERFR